MSVPSSCFSNLFRNRQIPFANHLLLLTYLRCQFLHLVFRIFFEIVKFLLRIIFCFSPICDVSSFILFFESFSKSSNSFCESSSASHLSAMSVPSSCFSNLFRNRQIPFANHLLLLTYLRCQFLHLVFRIFFEIVKFLLRII